MTVLRRFAPFALLVVGAFPALVFACSSSSGDLLGGPTSPPQGSDGSSTEDGASTPPPTPDSVAPDAPTSFIVDAGPPDTFVPLNPYDAADTPDGGAKVSPGVIGCGPGATCDEFASNQCCVGGAAGSVCQAASVPCAAGSASVTCNEAADCTLGRVCCGTVVLFDAGGPAMSAKCATTCASPPLAQLCRTNGECADGGACVVQKCSDGNTYELCGLYAPPADAGPFRCTLK